MEELLFGTCGIPYSAKSQSSFVSGLERIKELGLDCVEIKFPHEAAALGSGIIAETAANLGIKLSAHAPYSLNFNASDRTDLAFSRQKLIEIVRITESWGGHSVTFHPAFYLGKSPEKAYSKVKKQLGKALDTLQKEGIAVTIRPETTGKLEQLGTLEEIVSLCTEVRPLSPAIHFPHLHARTGGFNSYNAFASVLQRIEQRLGKAALYHMHIYVCGISYNEYGECEHLNLSESDFNYCELMDVLRDYNVKGVVICESPNLETDALLLKEAFLYGCQEREPIPAAPPVIIPEIKEEEPEPEPEPKIRVIYIDGCDVCEDSKNIPGHKKKRHPVCQECNATIPGHKRKKHPVCNACEEPENIPGHKRKRHACVTGCNEYEADGARVEIPGCVRNQESQQTCLEQATGDEGG